MIFKTNKNGITIGGKTVDEISEDFDKLSNYISEKASKISSNLSAVQDKINSKNTPSTWSYDELPNSNISNLNKENYSIADKIREQNEYNELLKNENSSIEAAIELSKRRAKNYDETLPKLTEINNEYEKQRQLELEDKYNSTIKERNNEYDKYLSNLNTEVEESKKVQDSIENISPDTLEELGYKQKGYLKEIREEQQQFSDALTMVDTASVESLLPKKEDVKGYYDELLAEQREFQSQLNAIETTPIDSLKRDQYSEILSEQADGQMALNLSATEYNDTLSTQNDLSNQRVLTLSEETDGQMALIMAENEGVSAKQKDIAETTSQIAAKEALVEASNKELLSNVNEKLAKTGVTSATEELTIAKLREIAASNEEGSALAKETLEMLGLGEASKATSIALKGLAMVGNMIAAWAIAEVLQLVVKGLDELANSVDNCKERVDNLMSSYQTALDTANSNASRVEELASDYEKLSKGVNNLGENVSLTSEEYEQYNSLVSEIADMFPTLIQGYNDQGTAILNLKGNVEGLRDAYKEAQTEAYNTLIASGENGDGNDIIKQWEDVHDPGFFAGLFDLGSADVGGKISVSDALAQLEEIQKLTAEEYRNIENIAAAGSHKEIESLTDIQKEIGYGSYIGKALGIDGNVTDKEFEEAKKQAKALVQTYNAEIESALSDVETLANAYLMTNDDYSKLTDSSKTAASLLVNNLTENIASDFSSKEDVGSWVDSVVSKLQNNPTLSNAINGLFTIDLSNMSVDESKAVVDQYINTIAKILEEDPVDVKVRLGFDDYNDDDIAPLKTKVQGFLKDEFDDKVGELSLDDLQVASKLEIPEGTLLSWDELKQKIEETKNAASNETPISSFKDAWESLKNSTDDGLKGQADELLKLAEAGRLTENALEKLAGGKELMNKTGLSAEQLAEKINKLTDSATQLSSMSSQISKMSDMLADKKNGTVASASDLAGFDVSVRGLESWDEFERVMGDSTSTMNQCQKAANALATEWVNDGNFLSNLTDENKAYYETQLDQMGVANAQEVITDALARKHEEEAIEEEYAAAASQYNAQCKDGLNAVSANLAEVTAGEITRLQQEGIISADTAEKISVLAVKKAIANGTTLDTSGDILNLANLAGAATQLGRLLESLAKIKQGFTNGMPSDVAAKQAESYQKQIEAYLTGGSNKNIDTNINLNVNPKGSRKYKPSGGSGGSRGGSRGGSKTKDSKQEINWIERKLSVLQSKIDLTKSKFDNLFNLTSPKNLKKNIDSITKSLSSAKSKADSFKKKMSVVKLDDSTKKKVKKGTVKLSDYSKNDQKRIKQYHKYYSSYEKYATKVKNLQKQLNTLNSSRGKINNLKTQIKQMKALESATSKAIKKYESYAGKVGLSKSLRNKVKNGDYTITDYGSKTQAKIQKYQDYIDKIAELRQQLQEIQGDIRDTKIQEYQLRADDADAKRSKSESWTDLERVDNYKKINSHLEYQKKQVKESYKWQIKVAEAEGDSTKASQLRAEREKELRNLTKQEFDAIASAYDYQLKLNDAKRQGVQDALSLAESRGDQIGSAYYSSQISVNNADLNTRYEERERLLKKLSTMKKGSEEWYDSYDTLQGVNKEISSLINNNAELDRKIKQLKWDRFDELKNKIDDVITEASFLSDLLDSDNFFDDKGMITNDGVTAMGLTAMKGNIAASKRDYYKEQLAQLEKDYNNGNGTIGYDDYISMQREYKQGIQDSVKEINDARKATIDYVKQGLDAQNEALSKEIEQRKKLLEQAKTERDFNDKTLDQNKKIARLKRQIAILENDDSDSNRKTLRELRSQLQDVEKEQSDSFYDKSVSDQEDALDNMLENSKKQAEEYLKDTDKVFADAIVYVNAHADQVSTTLTKLAQDTGYNISEYITKAWRGSGSAVGDYASTMSKNVPKITQQIALITGAWEAQCLAADRAAEASAKAAQGFYSKGSGSGSGNNNADKQQELNKLRKKASDITEWISKHSAPAKHKKSYYGALNQYLYDKQHGQVLSEANEVALAKKLGVSVKSDLSGKNDREKIASALKKLIKDASFSTGGVIKDLVKLSGEDGISFLQRGEAVLSKEQTQALLNFKPVIPQIDSIIGNLKNIPIEKVSSQSPTYQIDNRTIVEGVATDQIVKQMEGVAQKQAENVVRKINQATYAKGVRFR